MATQSEEGRLSSDKAYNVVTKQYYTSQETRDSRYVACNKSWFSFLSIWESKNTRAHFVLNPSHLEIGFNVKESLENILFFKTKHL